MGTRSLTRLSTVFSVMLALLGIAVFSLSFVIDGTPVPFTHWWLGHVWFQVTGVAIFVLTFITRRAPPQWSLSMVMLGYCMFIIFAFCHRQVKRGDIAIGFDASHRVFVNKDHWFDDMNQFDSYFGHFGQPNASGQTHHPDFDAAYHLDANGFRRMPKSSARFPKLEIWFTGCSMTYGEGVNDTESYPAVLAHEAWPDFQVRNYSFTAWGTPQVYLALKQQFSKASRPPDVVVYGWIEHHLVRSYRRQSWRSKFDPPFPWFEVKDGQLQYQGLGNKENSTLPDTPETGEAERAVAEKLISEMNVMCREHGSKFVILGIHTGSDFIPQLCNRLGIPFIDLLTVVAAERHPHEGHPNRYWHRSTARWLAESKWLSRVTSSPALHRPGSVKPPPIHWYLETLGQNNLAAGLVPQDGIGEKIAVRDIQNPDKSDRKLRLKRGPLSFVKGRKYVIEFRIRGDAERTVEVVGNVDHLPWTRFMPPTPVTIHSDWQNCRIEIEAEATVDAAVIFLFDGSAASFEIEAFKITEKI